MIALWLIAGYPVGGLLCAVHVSLKWRNSPRLGETSDTTLILDVLSAAILWPLYLWMLLEHGYDP